MIGAMGPRRDRRNGNGLARHHAGDRGAAWGRGLRCGMAPAIATNEERRGRIGLASLRLYLLLLLGFNPS